MNNKKVVIVTGAGGGIGHEIARTFAKENYSLLLSDIRADKLNENVIAIKKEFNVQCLSFEGDLTQMDYIEKLIETAIKNFGRIDVLINNAVWRTIETMRKMEIETWERTLKVCLTAPAFLSKLAASKMEELAIPGVIINISSMMSQRAGGSSPAYIASKGAIESLTYELAVLYGPKRIRVVAVSPGAIDTGLSNNQLDQEGKSLTSKLRPLGLDRIPLQRMGHPKEIANVCYWLSTDQASYITGTCIVVDGGLQHNYDEYSAKKIKLKNDY